MNYVGRIQLSESYVESFSLKIGLTDLQNNGEKSVQKNMVHIFQSYKSGIE